MEFDMFKVPDGITADDLKAAMITYSRQNDNWFANSYELWLRAEKFDDKYNATKNQTSAMGKIAGVFLRAAYGYERAALRAQAHQNFRFAVAERKAIKDYGVYHGDFFTPPGELLDMIRQDEVKRQNIANGHDYLYKP